MNCFNKSSEKVAQKRFCKVPQHLDHFSQESHCHSWVSHKSWSRNPRNPLRSAKIYRKIRADTNNSLWASSTGIRLSHQMLWNAFFATPSFEIKMTQLYSEYTSYLCHVLYVLTYGIAIVHPTSCTHAPFLSISTILCTFVSNPQFFSNRTNISHCNVFWMSCFKRTSPLLAKKCSKLKRDP